MEKDNIIRTPIDLKKLTKRESYLFGFLNQMVVGQDFAKKTVINRYLNKDNGLRLAITGDKAPATLLFIGPTGSGKMHLIKSFAQMFLGDENALVRVNCTLFHEGMITQEKIDQHGFSLYKHMASDDAYKRAQENMDALEEEFSRIEEEFKKKISEGKNSQKSIEWRDKELKKIFKKREETIAEFEKFVENIKWQPGGRYPAVVVFEGIDEMHPGIVNILREILDSGTFTNANGDIVSFRNCFVFLKCNLLSEDLSSKAQIGYDTKKNAVSFTDLYEAAILRLKKALPIELLKGIGKENIVVFRPFSQKEMTEIINRKLDILSQLVSPEDPQKTIKIIFTEALRSYVYDETQDAINNNLGASSIDKIISLRICNRLNKMVENPELGIKPGDIIEVDVVNNEMVFNKIENIVL